MLAGEKVRLRSLEREDLPKIWQWSNDEEVMYYWGMPGFSISLAEIEHRFSRTLDARDATRKWFIIETLDKKPIGRMMYFNLDRRHHHAEIAIQIGEKEYWGQGYGTEATMLFLDYLFNELGLHRVYLYTQDYNPRAYRSYEKCGFVKEGVVRHRYFVNGQYHDGFLMGILRHEFNHKFKGRHGEG